MKTAKTIALIASILFLLAAVGTSLKLLPKAYEVVTVNNLTINTLAVPPTIEAILAIGSFVYWLYLTKQEKKGLTVSHARIISIALLILSIVLSWALTTWFILLPIYNLASTVP
jgi:hypothetical protein